MIAFKLAKNGLRPNYRSFFVKTVFNDSLKLLTGNSDPTPALKFSTIPQTALSFALLLSDPASRLFSLSSTIIPFLLTSHTMVAVGTRFFIGSEKMAVSTKLLSGGIFCTSIFGVTFLRELPILLLAFNVLQNLAAVYGTKVEESEYEKVQKWILKYNAAVGAISAMIMLYKLLSKDLSK